MYRTTHPPTDQAIHHQPTHPPCYSSAAANGCVVSHSNFARAGRLHREQNSAVVPKTITTAPPPTGTKALTHARNDRHPRAQRTQPTARQPINPSYRQTLEPTTAALQQYQVRTSCYIHQQTEAIGLYQVLVFYLENVIMGTLHLQRSTITIMWVRGSPTSRVFFFHIWVTAYQFRAVDSRLTDSGFFPRGGLEFFYIRMTAYYFMLTDSWFYF